MKKIAAPLGAIAFLLFFLIAGCSPTPPAPGPVPVPVAPVAPVAVVPKLPVQSDLAGASKPSDPNHPNGDVAPNGAPVPLPPAAVQPQVVTDGLGGIDAGSNYGNPWNTAQAVAYAKNQVAHPDKNYHNLCLHFVAWTWGWGGAGAVSAEAFGNAVPKGRRFPVVHPRDVPVGWLVIFFNGGNGHVVIAVGKDANGTPLFASNDIVTNGRISLVPLSAFSKWGMHPAFYTQPIFPNGFGRNPNPAPRTPVTPPATHGIRVLGRHHTLTWLSNHYRVSRRQLRLANPRLRGYGAHRRVTGGITIP